MEVQTNHHMRPLRRTRPTSSLLLQLLRRTLKLLRERTLDEDIVERRTTIEALPRGHPALPARLTALGVLLITRFDQRTWIADIEEAVSLWKAALKLLDIFGINPDHPAMAFFRRFDHARESGLLHTAVVALRCSNRSVEDPFNFWSRKLLPKSQNFASCVEYDLCTLSEMEKLIEDVRAYLAVRLGHSYMQVGSHDDAIAICRCVLPFSAAGYESMSLLVLGAALSRRFAVSGHLADLEEAIGMIHRALEEPGRASKEALAHFVVSEIRLSNAFRRIPDLESPRQLLRIMERILDFSSDERKVVALRMLGDAHRYFFACLGSDHADIDAAITAYRTLSKISPTHESLYGLGVLLIECYDYFRIESDINEAIGELQRAIELGRASNCTSQTISVMHRDLGVAYLHLFTRRGVALDLYTAIKVLRSAVASDPQDQTAWLQLAIADQLCFMTDPSQRGALDEAIGIIEHAVNAMRLSPNTVTLGAEEVAKVFLVLARSLASRFEYFGDTDDKTRAAWAFKEALELMKNNNSRCRLIALNEFITTLWKWAGGFRGSIANMASAIRDHDIASLSKDAVAMTGPPLQMLRAAERHARLISLLLLIEPGTQSTPFSDEQEMAAYQRVFDLVPRVAWMGFSISRRYEEIAKLCSVLRDAVFVAALHRDHRVLTWFEEGRGLVWKQIRGLRTCPENYRPSDVDFAYFVVNNQQGRSPEVLRSGFTLFETFRAPELRAGLAGLSERLQELSADLEGASFGVDPIALRRLAREREEALSSIRSQDGFKGFLQPMGITELARGRNRRLVVCINVHGVACHALILQDCPSPYLSTQIDNLHIIALPNLTPSLTQQWRTRLALSLGLQRKSKPAVFAGNRRDAREVLRELWLCVVQPILCRLGIATDKFPSDNLALPHVTWCTAGALAFLPLHAAGIYESGSPNACDLVVSSYTPNIASLHPRPTMIEGEGVSSPRILIVAQPDTDGFSALPGTVREAAAINAQFSNMSTSLIRSAATVNAVLAMMETHEYVHLACHGEQNSVDPLKSSFVLADGRLTLEMLMMSSSSIGELAFLSACETATGDEKVPDEVVHLAAGMLAVGYRSVVATLWSIGDNHAPLVADAFYKKLQQQRDADGKRNVARALHHAVAELRKRVGYEQFAQWVPFVHWGV